MKVSQDVNRIMREKQGRRVIWIVWLTEFSKKYDMKPNGGELSGDVKN